MSRKAAQLNMPGMGTGDSRLEKFGLHRPELRAWAMYDWANSAFITVVITAIFPIYYSKIVSAGLSEPESTFRFGIATTAALAISAVLSPVLGAAADYKPIKKRLLAFFLAVAISAVLGLFFVREGDWLIALLLFGIANIGANGSFVFYDSLLPHIASEEEMDRVSTAGYALGYVGGGLLLALNLGWILYPGWFGLPDGDGLDPDEATFATRLSFLSVGVWWLVFSIPLFLRVPEPRSRVAPAERQGESAVRAGLRRLLRTFRELRRFRHAFLMLMAFLIYNDGIGTIIRMAALYGASLGIGQDALIGAILITQFVGIPFAFLFGRIAGWIGTKPTIFIGLATYVGISTFGYFMKTPVHFFILAILVGMVQGGTQALSRSLFASLIPRHKAGEFFGFFAVVERFAGIAGPLLFAGVVGLTGSLRNAILAVIAFFVVGGLLLYLVDVSEGRKIARAAEAEES